MKTIEQKNRLIAEFMGYKFDIENKCEIIEDFDIVENIQTYETDGGIRIVEGGYVITRFLPEQMRYHTSWDWLMSVVDKIYKLMLDQPIDSPFEINAEEVFTSLREVNINLTFNKIVEFIEWYN